MGMDLADWMSIQGLKRARHIVQMVDWAQELIGLDGATIQDVARWAQIDGNQDIMTLEYMKNGDLWGFIKKLALAGQTVPNKVLWKIFICRKSFPVLCFSPELCPLYVNKYFLLTCTQSTLF